MQENSKFSYLKKTADIATPEQIEKINELSRQGYNWDKVLSTSCAAVVLRKDKDIWIFSLDGEILHNPKMIVIPVK